MHPVLVGQWKKQLLKRAADAFRGEPPNGDVERMRGDLLKKIGELTAERDLLARGQHLGEPETRARGTRHSDLSIRRQCELLGLARSTLYYAPVEVDAEDLALQAEIDRICTKWPFYGSRRIVWELRQRDQEVNRKGVSV